MNEFEIETFESPLGETEHELSLREIDQHLTELARENLVYRRRLKRSGRVLLRDAKGFSDKALLARLIKLGIELDPARLGELIEVHETAESLARFLNPIPPPEVAGEDPLGKNDWAWLAISALWERWHPQKYGLDQIEEMIQAGYNYLETRELENAVTTWITIWPAIIALAKRKNLKRLDGVDKVIRGRVSLHDWYFDYFELLMNFGSDDLIYFQILIDAAQDFFTTFSEEDAFTLEGVRKWFAGALTASGKREEAEGHYQRWLTDNPKWGLGYIGWATTYHYLDLTRVDLKKAESILRQGLAVPEVNDEELLWEELILNLKIQKRPEEARAAQDILDAKFDDELPANFDFNKLFEDEIEPVVPPSKTGRNEPCPCGSGKKYKKCCSGLNSLIPS